jgi:hypothetical protein
MGDGKTQLGSLHGRIHIETRLMDYYGEKRNKDNNNIISAFKKLAGISPDNV